MSNLIFIAFAIIIIFTVGKSFFLGRNNNSSYKDYFLDGVIVKPFTAFISIYGAVVGGFIVFGLVQIGFQGNLTGYVLGASYFLGIPFLLWAMKKIQDGGFFEKEGLIGLDALLKERFGSFTEKMFIIVTCFLFAGILAGQLIAILAFLKSYTDTKVAVIVLGVGFLLTVVYTVWHGLRAVLANDIIQGLFEASLSILIPLATIYFIWGKNWSLALETNSIGGEFGAYYPFLAGAFIAISFMVRADLWQRLALVEKSKQKSVVWCVVIALFIYYVGLTTVGIILKQNPTLFPFIQEASPSSFVPILIREIIGNWVLQVICISGLLIAILSSVDSYLNLIGLMVSQLLLPTFDKNLSDEDIGKIKVTNARVATLGVAMGTSLIAYFIPDLVDIMSASFGMIGILVPIIAIALLRDKKLPDYVGGIPLAISFVLLLITIPILKKQAFVVALVLGLISFFVLLLFSKQSGKTGKNNETPSNV
jgi:Na+/proline symporter